MGQRLPEAGSAAPGEPRATQIAAGGRTLRQAPPPGPRGIGDPGASPLPSAAAERADTSPQESGFPRAPGILGSSATPRGSGLPNGENRMRARARWGRRPRGEGRGPSPAGRGAPRPRRMRREGAQSRTRLAATGWGEESPDGESAKEIWPPPRARSR